LFFVANAAHSFQLGILRDRGEGHPQAVEWRLQRNCSVTPAQLGCLYFSLCVLSLGIASAFWLLGAHLVMPFAFVELLVFGGALLVYARHARDGEKILLQDDHLLVDLESGGRVEHAEFSRAWVRVEPSQEDGSLVKVSAQGRSVVVGRYLRPELRPVLARELRRALRDA
jgi:uncharacterized membrane protein